MKNLLLCLALFLSLSAEAKRMSLADFQKGKDQAVMIYYINGVGQGYLYANAYLLSEGRPPIYCQPMGLTLIGFNYLLLLESEIKNPSIAGAYPDDTPVEAILLNALLKNFQCNR